MGWYGEGVGRFGWVFVGMGGCEQMWVGVHGCANVCGMNFQNFFQRIESLHHQTLIRILYESFIISLILKRREKIQAKNTVYL